MDFGSFVALIFFSLVIGVAIGLAIRLTRARRAKVLLAEHGVKLDYNYQYFLGLSTQSSKVLLCTPLGHPMLIDVDEVRAATKESILQTKQNAWGMQFHKSRHCKISVQTSSLERPVVVVNFPNAKKMDLWHARLSTFCKLT